MRPVRKANGYRQEPVGYCEGNIRHGILSRCVGPTIHHPQLPMDGIKSRPAALTL